ncbi:hypothetical protein BU23DRAFT_582526 [Bimuria novae-zelandiae CBS 107.79]|uniref:Uncharacterized protein n=1 Tax=Bimuria novae-zelandiae CBS 107.79 TaxID=1447943 RepID=A0A6A5V8I0_9PLEO|nr:hypothetical protein BU23DRAFT_582526 [Bimuria novae-zelandiae CBS 107.79]
MALSIGWPLGKRSAPDSADQSRDTSTSHPKPVSRLTAPSIVRRHRHRRENVAASVWGPSVPGADSAQPFSVYKAILRHPNIFFQFAIRLPPKAMIDLYSIDKEFHYRFNKYSTSIINDYATYHCPKAAYIFSWVFFPELCISDPMLRPMDGRPHLARDIPSLRWTKMVMYREHVIKSILTILAIDGHRVPRETNTTLMKFWLLMEMNTSSLRSAFLSDKTIWADQDIYFFHLLSMKLDMYFNHPVRGHGMVDLSHMMLTQKTLTPLYKMLAGHETMDYDDGVDLMIKTYHEMDLDLDENPWLADEVETGIPTEESGILMKEGWDPEGDRMDSPVDMVGMEGVRRGLDTQMYLIDFLTYGYYDREAKQNIAAPRRWWGEEKVGTPPEPWPVEEVRKHMIERLNERCRRISGSRVAAGDTASRIRRFRLGSSKMRWIAVVPQMTPFAKTSPNSILNANANRAECERGIVLFLG